MRKSICVLFMVCFLITIAASCLFASWYETENLKTSNSAVYISNTRIADSPYFINGSTETRTIIDISTGRIKDSYYCDTGLNDYTFMKSHESGWEVYFYQYIDKVGFKLGKQEISKDLEFGDVTIYEDFLTKVTFIIEGIESRNEFWFAADKLYRLKTDVQKWTTFEFPAEWDKTKYAMTSLLVTDDNKKLLIASYVYSTDKYQGYILDLDSNTPSSLSIFEGAPFAIEKWKNRQKEQYLIMTTKNLIVYDSETKNFDILLEGVNSYGNLKIFQANTGNYVYSFKKPDNPNDSYTEFNVMDLVNKNVKAIKYSFEGYEGYDGFVVSNEGKSLPYYDRDKNWIWTLTKHFLGGKNYELRLSYIDLSDFSLKHHEPDTVYTNIYDSTFCYFPDYQKFSAVETDYKSIIIGDLATGNQTKTVPIAFTANNWNETISSENSTLISNKLANEFLHLSPIGKRDSIETVSGIIDLCKFPGQNRALVHEYDSFREYSLVNGSGRVFNLPYTDVNYLYSDTKQNQIIGIGNSAIQFIKSKDQINSWTAPESSLNTKAYSYNPDDESIWAAYQKTDTGNWYFYKVLSENFVQLNSFSLSANSFSSIFNFISDPTGKYLYFINENTEQKLRELIILDVEKKELVKRITLQTEVKFTTSPIPGIVPIPSKDQLLIWDHTASWLIKTKTLEVIKGNVISNPYATKKIEQELISGVYDEEKGTVVLVDFNRNVQDPNDKASIYTIDVDNGNVVDRIYLSDLNTIYKFSFSDDAKEVFLLSTSWLYTYHLDPAWKEPVTIEPRTNSIQLGTGDHAKFKINIKNLYDAAQNATAYIWLYVPGVDAPFFFTGSSLSTTPVGIPLTLPANLDVTGDILTFTMPSGLPEGFYNFNAVFINENGDRGPIGTWNFYVKD
jgi:hypothetical protein